MRDTNCTGTQSRCSFNLRKFSTNSPHLQMATDKAESMSQSSHSRQDCNDDEETYTKSTVGTHCLLHPGTQKILGVYWDVMSDHLLFSFDEVAAHSTEVEPTKRNIVSVVSKFYDPLGLVTLVTTRFKVLIGINKSLEIPCKGGSVW